MTYASNGLKCCQEITRLTLTHIDHDYKLRTIFKSAVEKQCLNDGTDNKHGVKYHHTT